MRFGAAGVIHDAHEPGDGWLTFTEAFAKSSNICFAKIARALTSEAMYDELRAFGFGSLTGIELPGEVDGSLQLPRDWSGRTRLSLGYGHEIGVTAVQLAGLYTTIASGGVLRRPTIVQEVDARAHARDDAAIRRVLEPELAASIQSLCRGVVDSGTGEQARIEGVATAGKTGTAQKSIGGRYVQRFVASFGGFVPAEDPRLVCLVVLDEPRGYYHWGGQSAAPTFQRIVEGILRDGRWLEPQADRVRLVHGDDLGDDPPLDRFVRRKVTTAGVIEAPAARRPLRATRARAPKRAGLWP
jgi:cell division protein FtsI/penicillin-binding protein 2